MTVKEILWQSQMSYVKSTPSLADGAGFTTPEGVFTLLH